MDVHNKVRNGDYSNKMEYPKQPRKPVMPTTKSSADVRKYADELEVYETAMVEYKEARTAYYAESARLEAEFRKDLEAEHDMTDHPKRDKLYSMAYSYGHSSGLGEVATHYAEFVELV
jgi:hypothetical protein